MSDDATLSSQRWRSRFWRLAAVNVISNLMVPLAGLADSAFLGHLTSIRYLAGVALATTLFNFVYRPCNFLRMGTVGPTARARGANDADAEMAILLRNSTIALGLGAAMLLLHVPLREWGFALFNATADVKASGEAYYNWRVWSAPATLLNFVILGWLLGRERSSLVLFLAALANGCNVLLDYWFIFRAGWQSAGAGLATAMSEYLVLGVGIVAIAREARSGRWRVPPHLFERQAMAAALQLNSNLWMRSVMFTMVFALFTQLSASLGTLSLAANTLLWQVAILAVYFIDGFAFATESLAGNFSGSGMKQQLWPLLKLSGIAGASLGVAFALGCVWFPLPLFGLLTDHLEAIAVMEHYVIWLLPVLGFGSIAFVLDGYFVGLADGLRLRNSAVAAAVVGFAPLAIASWHWHANQLLWAALSSFMLVRTLVLGRQVPKTLVRVPNFSPVAPQTHSDPGCSSDTISS